MNNIPSNKENVYQKTPIEPVQTEAAANERRNSFFANRNASGEPVSLKDSYEGNKKILVEEENKYYQQSPLLKPSKPLNPSNSSAHIPNKQAEKENNIRESASYQNIESKEKKEEKEKINNLIKDVKNVLYPIDKKKIQQEENVSDDENFEEDPSQRVVAK